MTPSQPASFDLTDVAATIITVDCCQACGHPQHMGGLCSYECDRVDEAGTFEVRYVRVDRAADALRERGKTFSSRRTRGPFYMAADVLIDLFGGGRRG